MNKLSWFSAFASFTALALAALACGGGVPTTNVPATVAPTTIVTPTEAVTPVTVHPSPNKIVPGDHNNTINFGGETRSYILHIPPGYNGTKALPLVFLLAGYHEPNTVMESATGMDQKADKGNFIVVYPEGTGTPVAWNALFFPVRASQPDDVGFISALLASLEKDLRIDPRRIYAGGISNGGMMSYLLGAKLSDQLAAIAVVSGTVGAKQADGSTLMIPNPVRPLSVIAIHGRQDPTVPYQGGVAFLGVDFLSVADSIGFWVKQDGCINPPNTKTSQNGNVIEDVYAQCQGGSEVFLISIGNGKHDWPTSTMPDQISATDVIWEFFMRHPKP